MKIYKIPHVPFKVNLRAKPKVRRIKQSFLGISHEVIINKI